MVTREQAHSWIAFAAISAATLVGFLIGLVGCEGEIQVKSKPVQAEEVSDELKAEAEEVEPPPTPEWKVTVYFPSVNERMSEDSRQTWYCAQKPEMDYAVHGPVRGWRLYTKAGRNVYISAGSTVVVEQIR